MRNFYKRNPLISILLFFAVIMASLYLVGMVVDKFISDDNLSGFIIRVILISVIIVLNNKVFKINMSKYWNKSLLCLVLLVPLIIPIWINTSQMTLAGLSKLDLHSYVVIGLYAFSVGAFEEIFMRGVLLNGFLVVFKGRKNQIWLSIITSSVLFGIAHIINVFEGRPIDTTIFQVFYATMFGLTFSAAYLRTNNLLIPIFIHGVIDYSSFLQKAIESLPSTDTLTESVSKVGILALGASEVIRLIFLCIIPALFSFFYLRQSKREEVLNINPNIDKS